MTSIKHSTAQGESPALDDDLLPEDAASYAENVRLEAGALHPWSPYKNVQVLSLSGIAQTIYNYSDTWYSWEEDVDLVRSVIDDDQYDRVYFTGYGKPRVMGSDIAPDSYLLGVPVPDKTPTVSVSQPRT